MNASHGIPQEVLDKIEREYLCKTIEEIPSSPMISDEILDAIPFKHLDLHYADQDEAQRLDLYLPPEAQTESVPLFIHIHGGGFVAGDKQDMQVSIYFDLLNHGYAVASVEYRLAPKAQFPEPVQDCKAAVRYLKAHALEHHIDPARVAVGGGSAGAYYALMVATSPNIPYLEDLETGDGAYGTEVRCCVAAYPATSFLKFKEHVELDRGVTYDYVPDSPECLLMGAPISDLDPAYVETSDPCFYVTPQIPPIFLRAGTGDMLVPHQQSILFADAVKEVAGPEKIDFALVEGAGHADPAFRMPHYLEQVLDFLDRHLK